MSTIVPEPSETQAERLQRVADELRTYASESVSVGIMRERDRKVWCALGDLLEIADDSGTSSLTFHRARDVADAWEFGL